MNPISPSQSTTRTYGVLADDDPEWVRIREQEDIYDRYVDSDDDQADDPAAAHEPAPCVGCGQPTTLLLDTGEDRDGRVILEPACGPCQDGPPDDAPPAAARMGQRRAYFLGYIQGLTARQEEQTHMAEEPTVYDRELQRWRPATAAEQAPGQHIFDPALQRWRHPIPVIYTTPSLPAHYVAAGDDGHLYLVPIVAGGWEHRSHYQGHQAGLQRLPAEEARLAQQTVGGQWSFRDALFAVAMATD